MNKKYITLSFVSLIIVILDQLTKIYIYSNYQLGESTPLIPGFFNITYVRNMGAAFGFLGQTHPTFRELFFLAMPPVAMGIIFVILRGVANSDRWQIIALSAVFGGAIGNYIDRVRFRYVVDFLDFHWREIYTWPAFNIADSAIVCGMGAIVVIMLREARKNGSQEVSTSNASRN